MRFALTPDQSLFADALRELLGKECPPDRVRTAWDEPTDRSLWEQLAAMGVIGLQAPESAGGLGLGALDLHGLLVESGRVALVDPIVDTAAVAVPALAAVSHGALADVVSGDRSIAVGFAADPVVRIDSDHLLLEADDGWHLVDTTAVSATPEHSVDGARRLASVEWTPRADSLVVGADLTPVLFDRAIVGVSAQLLGLSRHLLEATVAYVQDREQFGRPVGANQALKHKLADVLLAIEFAEPVVARAAHSIDTADPHRSLHSAMAKVYAGEAARLTAAHALQCHGAIAYTVEYDLHMWMKRVWALSAQWGTAAAHRRRVTNMLATSS